MDILSLIVSAAACTGPSYICDASARTGLNSDILYAVCFVETKLNTTAYASRDGKSPSYGVCQIKLNTARGLGFKGAKEALMNPSTNAYFAAKYIQLHLKHYKNLDKAISAYNAGKAINGNWAYVAKVKKQYKKLRGPHGQY